jgi:hypothetical protein
MSLPTSQYTHRFPFALTNLLMLSMRRVAVYSDSNTKDTNTSVVFVCGEASGTRSFFYHCASVCVRSTVYHKMAVPL